MSTSQSFEDAQDGPSPIDYEPTTPQDNQEVAVYDQSEDFGFIAHTFLQAGIPLTTEGRGCLALSIYCFLAD